MTTHGDSLHSRLYMAVGPGDPIPLEAALSDLVTVYGISVLLKAFVEVCYGRAKFHQRIMENQISEADWTTLARMGTCMEAFVERVRL